MTIIDDGKGTGNKAQVVNNRVQTNSITLGSSSFSAQNGESYNINTGDVLLTSAGASAVLYVKNNENRNLIIKTIVYLLGNSTGGTGDLVATVIRNPTEGTIIDTTPTNVDIISNRNYGSSRSLVIDAYKGSEADTITNGDDSFLSRLSGASQGYQIGTGDLILSKGSSIGVEVTPQTSNTNMTIQIALSVYLQEEV